MKPKACSGCGAPVVWRFNLAGTPEPYNPGGSSHFGNCPHAYRFMPPEPGGPYAGEGQPERSVWDELNREEVLEMQLEEGRQRVRESGVMACRENQRDPRDGDKWCRACFQARPAGHSCPAGNFKPPVRYAKVDGELVSLTGNKLTKFLRSRKGRGLDREQALV